jgi:hydroxypyruvate isomerase
MRRREFLGAVAATGGAAAAEAQPPASTPPVAPRKERIKQALMRFNFGAGSALPFDDMCREAARLGYHGFDLVGPPDWPALKKHGLVCTMAPAMGVTIRDGLIRPELHDAIEKSMREEIDLCATNGWPNFITVGGERRGIGDDEGKAHCASLLNRVKSHAEDKGVTICIEVVNSKYKDPNFGRADAIFDHLAWGADVCKRVNSPRVKILFDIYHVQIMEGDVCANIKEYFPLIAHFHTAGVPGRREIDDTQELNYRRVMQAIAELPFSGFVAQEFVPKRDPLSSMRQAFEICDV